MVKYLKSSERKFNVCSDCVFFHKTNVIDERFPQIVEGYCDKHDGIKDNRWEIKCKDCTANCTCLDCYYYDHPWIEEEDMRVHWCTLYDKDIDDETELCNEFVFEKDEK